MTTKNRLWRLLAVIFAFTLIAAACGDDDTDNAGDGTSDDGGSDDSGDDGGDDMADDDMADDDMADDDMGDDGGEHSVISDECPIPDPENEIEVDVIGWEFPVITQYAEEIRECEDGNYRLNIQFLESGPAREQMLTDAATGSPTFELYQGANSHMAALVAADAILPLNDLIDQYSDQFGFDDIQQSHWDAASIDGNIYTIPMVSNVQYQFYNEPVLTDLGIDVPTTYTEALAACAALQDAGYSTGYMIHTGATWSLQIEFYSVLGAMGEQPIDPATGQPNFNTDTGKAAAALLKQFRDECIDDAAGAYGTSDIQAGFQSGELVLGHTWASRSAAMEDEASSTVVGDINFAPALTTDDGTTRGSSAYIDGWFIPAGTPEELIEPLFLLMAAATDAESQSAASEFNAVTRSSAESANAALVRAADAFAVTSAEGRGPDLTHPAASIANSKLGTALDAIVNLGEDLDSALQTAEDEYLAEAGEQGLLS